MRFSRDNMIISNRCGEYLNAHKYFRFFGNEENLEISLLFINNNDEKRHLVDFKVGKMQNHFFSSIENK